MIMLGEMDRNVGHRTLLNVEVSFLLCNRYVYFVCCSVYRKLVVL